MGYEKIYGPSVPCPCGKGKATYYRVEHDTYPSRNRRWGELEIECPECSAKYVVMEALGDDSFYFVPKDQAAGVTWNSVAKLGFAKAAPAEWH